MLPNRVSALNNESASNTMSTIQSSFTAASCYNNSRTPFAIQEILGLNIAGMPAMRSNATSDNVMQSAYFMPSTHNQTYAPSCFLEQAGNSSSATVASMSGMFPLDMNSANFMNHIPSSFDYVAPNTNCDCEFLTNF